MATDPPPVAPPPVDPATLPPEMAAAWQRWQDALAYTAANPPPAVPAA